ncbi:MAG: orotate phosphoribosyltransferase [Candidatus Peribacteraceae bacterium]|nr:orotate phosphoribosyltransferase [Candidatus Peribacteraceae bacterium]
MPHGERIAEYLLSIGAVKLSTNPPFTWTSGLKAPIYCDNRMIYSHPEARDFVVQALANRVKNLHVEADVIAGTALAAIGWGALVADRLKLPFVYVRAKPKEHGAKKLIEGDLKPGKHVILVEDLISTAKSSGASVEAIRNEGQCFITDIVSIFSYELASGIEKARELKVKLHPLATISLLIDKALEQDRITPEQADQIGKFSADPDNWAAKAGL